MKGRLRFTVVDVFARARYEGNQLAVVRGAGALSTPEMQSIAREFNFSETTFLLADRPGQGGFPVRIFTPAEEVPFAGHPTLGTALVLQEEVLRRKVDRLDLALEAGSIPVTFEEPSMLWMRQLEPAFGAEVDPGVAAGLLGLAPEEVDGRFPAQVVSTGLPFLIVPLRSLEAARRARADRERLAALQIGPPDTRDILLFAPETYGQGMALNVRVFVPFLGIPEDPATGSANGCLAGWLVRHRYFGGGSVDIRVEQGMEIGRPSEIALRAREAEGGHIEVSVGGQVHLVARGELL